MQNPSWLNIGEYPFKSHLFETKDGALHYIDEGTGPPVVMIHGTPTWSFLYRNLVKELMGTHRCIVPDMLGFGLSDKPFQADYRPAAQAQRLEAFLESLNLPKFTLIVHDFGGPIGLSYAINHPEKIERIVLSNTWMWSEASNKQLTVISAIFSSFVGKYLYLKKNFAAKVMMKQGFASQEAFTEQLQLHYHGPFPDKESRMATWSYARELRGSSAWYDSLWNQREKIANIPALILWGMKDAFFQKQRFTDRWKKTFVNQKFVPLDNAGHFVQEEAEQAYNRQVKGFLVRLNEQIDIPG